MNGTNYSRPESEPQPMSRPGYVDAGKWLRSRNGGRELTFAQSLRAFRECDELTLAACAELVGVPKQRLWDFESGRRLPSPSTAKQIGERMGYGDVFVATAIQDALDRDGLSYRVILKAKQ